MGPWQQPGIAGHIHDRASEGFHSGDGVLTTEKGALQVRVQDSVPLGFTDFRDRFDHTDPSIVDEDMQSALLVTGLLDEVLHSGFPADIADRELNAQLLERLSVLRQLVQVAHGHASSHFRQHHRASSTNSRGAAGHDG